MLYQEIGGLEGGRNRRVMLILESGREGSPLEGTQETWKGELFEHFEEFYFGN